MFLGIDPGKTGGFCLLSEEGETLEYGNFSNWKCIRNILDGHHITSASLEKVSSMTGQGVVSTFTFGMNYGGWQALLEFCSIPHTLVPPNRWQKMFLGSFPKGESKLRSLDFIRRKYPHVELKKSDHGISDAICLALYALVMHKRLHA